MVIYIYPFSFVLLAGPPPAPTNLRVKQSRAQGFIMEWDYVRNDLAFYDITITKTSDRTVQNFQMKDSKSPQLRQFLTYEFTGLTQSTEYSIRMRATDEKGQVGAWSEPFVTTTVDKMPPLLIESPPVVMRVGEDRTIEIPCVIEGLPEPKFEWFRDGTQITESENVEIEGGILRLKAPKRGSEGSEGKYKCRGTNEFGSAESEETQLIVECRFSPVQLHLFFHLNSHTFVKYIHTYMLNLELWKWFIKQL